MFNEVPGIDETKMLQHLLNAAESELGISEHQRATQLMIGLLERHSYRF